MVFTPDTTEALEAAMVLANSALRPDALNTTQALMDFCKRLGYAGESLLTGAELESVRAIRPRLHELLSAESDDAVNLVNGILADFRARPRLVRSNARGWHVHAALSDYDTLASRILVETAMAMIDVISADELGRLGVCIAEGCDGLFLDLSRNRSRRYCSTACANRDAVAAYRGRQKV